MHEKLLSAKSRDHWYTLQDLTLAKHMEVIRHSIAVICYTIISYL